ncbi:MAG TPA: dienelactone hydrolase family protein [Gammaproteobacteria bacterium]|nr:dienelactone hydrolase family protein [Gammaproteobacteria bacterium]
MVASRVDAGSTAEAAMRKEYFDYPDGDLICEGYVAYEEAASGRRPGVLVSHTWAGQGEPERATAERLAARGYVGCALDLYGKGVRGRTREENARLMQPFMDDRALLRRRINAALAALQAHPAVDPERTAAVGYCFGGLCVLDLARSAPRGLRGVVSIHGMLHAPKLEPKARIGAKVLILHGYDDPLAPPEHVLAVARELTEAGADWQLHAYGGTMHAFTNPAANAPEQGLKYNEAAARRAWIALTTFLEEALA